VTLECQRPLFCDAYKRNPATGSLILIHPVTNETMGAGMITGIQADESYLAADEFQRQALTDQEHTVRRRHHPAVLWVGSNDHLRRELKYMLFERGCLFCAIEERIAPENAGQLVRILSAAGLISIWSSLALTRTTLENAVESAGNIAFIAADDGTSSEDKPTAGFVCQRLEERGILSVSG
jgi:predicted GTPase